MSTKDIFENLVADITAQVLEQVGQQAQSTVAQAVTDRVDALVNNNYITSTIEERVNRAVIGYQPNTAVIEENLSAVIANLGQGLSVDLDTRINKLIGEKINEIDIFSLLSSHIERKLDSTKTITFPDRSINGSAIDVSTLNITGNNITGGVIKNFGSTGIDDQATECRVTILDQGTVFENTLYAPRIEAKGGALIEGDLEIVGQLVNNAAYQQIVSDAATSACSVITGEVLEQHQTLIFDRIQAEGIDLNKVTFNGKLIIDGDRLVGINNSQLRTVGTLQDLQTSGETFLSETLYTASKRVGVNTMDPKNALSVWDEEVEIGIGKSQKGIGRISAERETALVLGSNGNDNVILNTDGTTTIPKLQLNNMMFTTASTPPSYDARRGTVVFNESPTLGGPLGWVSLGDARWANFGIID